MADSTIFKTIFLYRFSPLELREMKIHKFINLHQGGMSVKEYSLKFTQFSKYAPTLVWTLGLKWTNNLWGYPMLWWMNVGWVWSFQSWIYLVLWFIRNKLKNKLKEVGRDLKRSRTDDGNSSKDRFEVHDNPRLKKAFPTKAPLALQKLTKR